MKRTPLRRTGPIARSRPKRRTLLEQDASRRWHEAVLASAGPVLRCAAGDDASVVRAHHAPTQQVLRRRAAEIGLDAALLLWDPRVGVKVSNRRHERHHARIEPILRAELPAAVHAFCAEYGLEWSLDRVYPKEGP